MFEQKPKHSMMKKLICVLLTAVLLAVPAVSLASAEEEPERYPFVFVSGFAGWGQYETALNEALPYWGRLNGDLMAQLNAAGFECYAASVDPVASAWDRACELYAQLTGNVVDYGKVHSEKYGHERYGTDFSKNPLLTGWDDGSGRLAKIHLIGHSFGGATIRLFAQLMASGSKAEQEGTPSGELSGLFTGGKADLIFSVTTLAAPHNGTTLTILNKPIKTLYSLGPIAYANEKLTGTQLGATLDYIKGLSDIALLVRDPDTGVLDLNPDGAAELNKIVSTIPGIYYFSVPTDATAKTTLLGNRLPDVKTADPGLWFPITFLGSTTGKTAGGIVYDKSWLNNDGVVNTISTVAPFGQPQQKYDEYDLQPGIWNIMPTYRGDHAAIIGGLTKRSDVTDYYIAHLRLLERLAG
ncbi:MAG TPA: hypothetical protein PL044_03030 [Clostridiales bacterium]|nr:MAG: Lipase precursor [Firmicutes bacterium ADurb.Bin262]HOU11202.1 hypothetical protein [Clostridiales bacterium]HQK72735.1 hypothetical protein [Clostridiales bacterium]